MYLEERERNNFLSIVVFIDRDKKHFASRSHLGKTSG